jgi:hypothetical protein
MKNFPDQQNNYHRNYVPLAPTDSLRSFPSSYSPDTTSFIEHSISSPLRENIPFHISTSDVLSFRTSPTSPLLDNYTSPFIQNIRRQEFLSQHSSISPTFNSAVYVFKNESGYVSSPNKFNSSRKDYSNVSNSPPIHNYPQNLSYDVQFSIVGIRFVLDKEVLLFTKAVLKDVCICYINLICLFIDFS